METGREGKGREERRTVHFCFLVVVGIDLGNLLR